MDFSHSEKVRDLQERITQFMENHVYPAEALYHKELEENRRAGNPWQVTKVIEDLKRKPGRADLWNLFLPHSEHGAGLTNLEYAPLCEIMGRSHIAPEAFNCSAPDTGNMEVLARYATRAQQQRWLAPLLDGKIRSAFAMTEPSVASSDATNIQSSIVRDGDSYVINGRKWWTSGAGDPRCEILIFMGKTNPEAGRHSQQSMILVPMKTPGVKVLRTLTVFGYDHAPHGHAEVDFVNVRVPAENLLLGEGRGFEIAQGRLGPGRIHHCMRTIGVAERALGTDVQARAIARRVRQEVVGAGRDARAHRRGAHHDRSDPLAGAECRLHDGHGRQSRGEGGDRDDQGRRSHHDAESARLGHPNARRRRRQR